MVVHRSFSELYQKAIQDAEGKSGEEQSGEAWVLDERGENGDEGENEEKKEEQDRTTDSETETHKKQPLGEDMGIPGSRDSELFLSPPNLPLLRATSLQDSVQSQIPEITPISLTRSCSLERHPTCQDILEGYTDLLFHTSIKTAQNVILFFLCMPGMYMIMWGR